MDSSLLDGLPDSRKPPYAQSHTGKDRRLTHKINTYDNEDPPVNQEKASLIGVFHSIMNEATNTTEPQTVHVLDLVQLGF